MILHALRGQSFVERRFYEKTPCSILPRMLITWCGGHSIGISPPNVRHGLDNQRRATDRSSKVAVAADTRSSKVTTSDVGAP